MDQGKADVLADLVSELREKSSPTNVAQVKQLSPFRYPGGKTWLVPEIRKWLMAYKGNPSVFVEPFAGGAMAGLTVAAENLAETVILGELDDDVAAVWQTIINGQDGDVEWLCNTIRSFEVNLTNVREVLNSQPKSSRKKAFRTIIKNRMQRGGIMAPGAGLVKEGEAGRGLMSRWYPATLADRIQTIRTFAGKIDFRFGDAFPVVREFQKVRDAFFFVDPPYTAGGKNAGRRLYVHTQVDHEALFALMAQVKGSVLMTYDDAPEVRELAAKHGFRVERVPMKNTHHEVMRELLLFKP